MRLFGRRLADLDLKARLAEFERITDARSLRSVVPSLSRRSSWRMRSAPAGSF
jgi:hypothetical protein